MAKKFKINHARAGKFHRGEIVSADEIVASGADIEFWKKVGAITAVDVVESEETEDPIDEIPEVTDPKAAAKAAQEAAAKAAQEAASKAVAAKGSK